MSEILSNLPLFPIAVGVVVVLILVLFATASYKKAPPDKAMVITGPRGARTITGKAAFVIPFLERVDELPLSIISIDVQSKDEIPTQDAININVDAIANVSVSKKDELLKIASSKFLGKSTNEIREVVLPVLEGNIREIVSQITLKELISGDKKKTAEEVANNVKPNLEAMGLELITFNIQNYKDKNGVIDNLGIENTSQISKDATTAKAAAESEIRIKKAEADSAANAAEVKAQEEIAERNNKLEIKKAELKAAADQKQAEADAVKGIEEERQRQAREVAATEADIARKEKEIDLASKEAEKTEKALESEVKKKADAEKYRSIQEADAALYEEQKKAEAELARRQRNAEAEKYEKEQNAEAIKIESEAKLQAAKNEAEGIEAIGKAEAEKIKAAYLAEAEGTLKKAEAMKQYGKAAVMDMQLDALKTYFSVLPEIAKNIAEPLKQVDSITMYGEGNTARLTEDITKTMSQVTNGIKDSTGIDPTVLLTSFVEKQDNNTEKAGEENIENKNAPESFKEVSDSSEK